MPIPPSSRVVSIQRTFSQAVVAQLVAAVAVAPLVRGVADVRPGDLAELPVAGTIADTK